MIFSFDALKGNETVQYPFSGTGGSAQVTGLVYVGGSFYGMTKVGGANNDGTIFSFTP